MYRLVLRDPLRLPWRYGHRRFHRLAIVLSLLLASCTSHEPWSFPATRATWGSDSWRKEKRSHPCRKATDDQATHNDAVGLAIGIILLGPLIVDVVLLPVTLPHDLLFAE
jgi:hypothetical protein